MKKLLILIGIVNILWAIAFVPCAQAVRAYARVTLMDKFYQLRIDSVLDEEAMQNKYSGDIVISDYKSVARFFLMDSLDLPVVLAAFSTIILFVNSILFFIQAVRLRGASGERRGQPN